MRFSGSVTGVALGKVWVTVSGTPLAPHWSPADALENLGVRVRVTGLVRRLARYIAPASALAVTASLAAAVGTASQAQADATGTGGDYVSAVYLTGQINGRWDGSVHRYGAN